MRPSSHNGSSNLSTLTGDLVNRQTAFASCALCLLCYLHAEQSQIAHTFRQLEFAIWQTLRGGRMATLFGRATRLCTKQTFQALSRCQGQAAETPTLPSALLPKQSRGFAAGELSLKWKAFVLAWTFFTTRQARRIWSWRRDIRRCDASSNRSVAQNSNRGGYWHHVVRVMPCT